MRRTTKELGLERAREKDDAVLNWIEANASYEERRQSLLNLERRWVRGARTGSERQRIQRGVAEDLVTLAYSFNKPWTEFGKWFRRIQRLGFSNLALRVHLSCLFLQSLHLFPRRSREAWGLLEDTERRARRLRRSNPLREEYLEAIAHARKATRVPRPSR